MNQINWARKATKQLLKLGKPDQKKVYAAVCRRAG